MKPKEYQPKNPGDMVQVHSLDVRPRPTAKFKHFTARDMTSRWDVIEAYRLATAGNAKKFLSSLIDRAHFPVKAIQVDGGSEFMAEFEQACAERDIRLFVLPPRSPKLNGYVERAQRTHTEEFYDLFMGELDLKSVNKALRDWEYFYNTLRPHHSLDLLRRPSIFISIIQDWLQMSNCLICTERIHALFEDCESAAMITLSDGLSSLG
jgi:putative transposase